MADTELFSLGTWIAFYSIALIAGVTQGAFGFGYPAIATPTLVLFTDVKTAIVVNMVPNLCVNFLSILRGGNYRASLLPHWPVAVYTLIASFLGALFLIVAPGEPLRLALALMVFAYLYSDRIRALDPFDLPALDPGLRVGPCVGGATVLSPWSVQPPSAAAMLWKATRARLFRGCCAVRLTPAVWQCMGSIQEISFLAPNSSFIIFAQMRRAARSFAISSKKSLWTSKKKESWEAKSSTFRPRLTKRST